MPTIQFNGTNVTFTTPAELRQRFSYPVPPLQNIVNWPTILGQARQLMGEQLFPEFLAFLRANWCYLAQISDLWGPDPDYPLNTIDDGQDNGDLLEPSLLSKRFGKWLEENYRALPPMLGGSSAQWTFSGRPMPRDWF